MYSHKFLNFVLLFMGLFTTSCISSEYLAGEPNEQITDDNVVGVWKLQMGKKLKNSELGEMVQGMKKVKISANKDKSYNIYLLSGNGGFDSYPLNAFIHKIQNENFVSIRGIDEDDEDEKSFFYAKYKIEGTKLLVYPVLEKKAIKNKEDYDIESEPKTKFTNESNFRLFIAKNLKNKPENIDLKEYYIYTKEKE